MPTKIQGVRFDTHIFVYSTALSFDLDQVANFIFRIHPGKPHRDYISKINQDNSVPMLCNITPSSLADPDQLKIFILLFQDNIPDPDHPAPAKHL
jgi:hypothetical protein